MMQAPFGNGPQQSPYGQQPPYAQMQHPSRPPAPYWPQAAYDPRAYGAAPGMAPSRNVGLIVAGAIALFVGLVSFGLFTYNAWQYATVEDRFADLEGASWVVDMIKESDLHRMMVFGPVALVFGLAGLAMGGFGLRKR